MQGKALAASQERAGRAVSATRMDKALPMIEHSRQMMKKRRASMLAPVLLAGQWTLASEPVLVMPFTCGSKWLTPRARNLRFNLATRYA